MILFILDVDETLIHTIKDKKDKNAICLNDDGSDLWLNPRPYLSEFIKFLYKNGEIAIWSAGEKSYIEFFVKKFILPLKIKPIFVWTRNDCDTIVNDEDKETDYIKPLSIIWNKYKEFNPRNTIIVDDKKSTAICNPTNHILIKRYENQDNDKELYNLGSFLNKNLKDKRCDVKNFCSKFR